MINKRILQLRKNLGLSGTAFGEYIGIKKSTVSSIENGDSSVTEGHIKLICTTWDVSENWLRNGQGEMFNPVKDDLDYMIAKYGGDLSPQIEALIKTFLTLTDEEKKAVDSIYEKIIQFDVFKADEKDD